MPQQQQQQEIVEIFGNLGRDPQPHTSPARTKTVKRYDEILDEVVDREITLEERNFLTFSLATGGYGDKPLRWHHVVDWEGVCFRLRQGDRVCLTGYFEIRTWEKDGKTRTERQFVVLSCQILKLKNRQEAA